MEWLEDRGPVALLRRRLKRLNDEAAEAQASIDGMRDGIARNQEYLAQRSQDIAETEAAIAKLEAV